MEESSFAELMARAKAGEAEAARLLIERYQPAIRRQVRFSLMDNQLRRVLEESDVCQSVMVQFFLGLWAGQFEVDGPEQLVGVLKKLVRHKVVDRARYWKAGRRDFRRDVARLDPGGPVDFPSPESTPSRVVSDADLLAEFERRLTREERETLALRRQGLSWAEIARRGDGAGPEAIRRRFEGAMDRVSVGLGLRD